MLRKGSSNADLREQVEGWVGGGFFVIYFEVLRTT